MSTGPNATEAARIVQRRRAKTVAVIMQAIETTCDPLDYSDIDELKTVVKGEVNDFADSITAMLPSLVDESVAISSLYLEMIADLHAKLCPTDDLEPG